MFRRALSFSVQEALRAAHGAEAEPEAQMGGNAESARMGDSLTVENREVRLFAETREGLLQKRTLAKREQTGDVGKMHFPLGQGFLDGPKVGKG
jgi:hypothetical protein